MKKKLTALALVVVMVAMLFTGLTMAYFTDNDSATNTFTVGDIEIEIFENGATTEGLKYDNVVPGVKYDKIVGIRNTGKNPAYVRVKVTIPEHMEPVWADNNDWTVSGPDNNGIYTVTYNKVLAAGETTSPCMEAVKLTDDVTETEAGPGSELKVIVDAEAIQADGFEDTNSSNSTMDEAWAAFDAQ